MKHLTIFLLCLPFLLNAEETLKVGMAAPQIKVGKWVKGAPVHRFERGHIYVVEFWATWCGPCIENIPLLTEMAKKHKGKVTVIGVSILEDNAKVEPFVSKMGDRMNYHVAYDYLAHPTEDGFMAKNWMRAAGQNGIPATFIVGESGIVEYIGEPKRVEQILEQVVAGTWDYRKYDEMHAREIREEEEKAKAELEAWNKTPLGMQYNKTQKLIDSHQYQEALKELDALATMPGDTVLRASFEYPKIWSAYDKMGIYMQLNDMDGYYRSAEECLAALVERKLSGSERYDVLDLSSLAWFIVDPQSELPRKDFDFALKVAKRATELGKPNCYDYNVLAWAYYRKGNKAMAMNAEKEAIRLTEDLTSPRHRADVRKRYEKNLRIFQGN